MGVEEVGKRVEVLYGGDYEWDEEISGDEKE